MQGRTDRIILQSVGAVFGARCASGLTDHQLLERFVTRRDETAFEALVQRHGPMVWTGCRRVLNDSHAAEDAFQAVFLVLVRRASKIRLDDSLGPWLHGVTRRITVRARAQADRRRKLEIVFLKPAAAWSEDDAPLFDLRPVLHEEIGRLPEKYRAPVVLCYLQEQTHEQAARELHWPVGTVRGRLARARALLRSRLTRRGLTLSVGPMVALLESEARAAVPPALVRATARTVLNVMAAPVAPAGITTTSATLAREAIQAMTFTKLKLTAAGALAASLLVAGAGTTRLVIARADDSAAERPTVAAGTLAASSDDTTKRPIAADETEVGVTRDEPRETSDDRSLHEALDRPISLLMSREPLGKVLAAIGARAGVTIIADVNAFAERRVSLLTPVSVVVTEQPVRDVLRTLLTPSLNVKVSSGMVLLTDAEIDQRLEAKNAEIVAAEDDLAVAQERLSRIDANLSRSARHPESDPARSRLAAQVREKTRRLRALRTPTARVTTESGPKTEIDGPNDGRANPATRDATPQTEQAAATGEASTVPAASGSKPGATPTQEAASTTVASSLKPSYVATKRKEVEGQIAEVLKDLIRLHDEQDALGKEVKSLDAVRAALKVDSKPSARRESATAAFLEKSRKEVEQRVGEAATKAAELNAEIEQAEADFKALRQVEVALTGSDEAAEARIRELLTGLGWTAQTVVAKFQTVARPVRQVYERPRPAWLQSLLRRAEAK